MKRLFPLLGGLMAAVLVLGGCSSASGVTGDQVSLSPLGQECKQTIGGYWAAFNKYDLEGCLAYISPDYAARRGASLEKELGQFEMGKGLGVQMVVASVSEPVQMEDGRLDVRVTMKITPSGLAADRYLMYYMEKVDGKWLISRQTDDPDKVPPGGPTNLDPISVTSGQVDIKWDDNSSRETGYRVERATDKDFKTDLVSFLLPPNTTTYSDTTIVPGVSYYYRVFAFSQAGDSKASARIYVTVPAA